MPSVRRALDLRMEGVLLIAHGQVVHPGLVAVAETEFQDVPGHLGGELTAFVAEDASEDRHLVFAGMIRSSAHVHSSVCMVHLA